MNEIPEQVNDIFQAALERAPDERARFLDENCYGDERLRREVESLLDSYQTGFLEESPIEEFADVIINSKALQLTNGSEIGAYKIIRQIGAGGMGEVFLAEDSKLKRQVALKFLSTPLTSDSEQLARFIREAQAVSALNHPNILTVHEIGVEDDVHFIATEFIDGHTLRETLRGDELEFSKLLSIAVQTAEALACAHEAGIIHRDIKPENIMVRRDGYVKILDFGLAKLTEARASNADLEAETQKLLMTSPGLIMGTACYMSPEQTRGLADVDARADVWSFGVVLFEMFAGRPPFEGNTVSDMIVSILKTETPPLSKFIADCPPELERIVTKALQKDRDERYQSMKDLALDLKSLRKDLEISSKFERVRAVKAEENMTAVIPERLTAEENMTAVIQQHLTAATTKRFSLTGVLSIVLGIVLIFGGIWWFYGRNTNEIAAFKTSEIVSWSSSRGEFYSVGAFSPNASMIAFTSTRGGTKNLWIKQTGSGEAIQVTKDEFRNEMPVWSPDGEELAFCSTRGSKPAIWRMPSHGGAPKHVADLDQGGANLRLWSNNNLIYFESGQNLFAVDAGGGEKKNVVDFPTRKINANAISISPDEQTVAFVSNEDEKWSISTLAVSGGEPQMITSVGNEIKNTAWHPDNKRVFYSAMVDGTFQIFVAGVQIDPKQITFGDKDSLVLDVSSDGTKILYGSAKEESDIWSVNISNSKETAVASDIDSELWADVSPDGKTLVYQSVKNLSQGNKLFTGKIVTKELESNEQPAELVRAGGLPVFSREGEKVAFVRVSGNEYQLAAVSATGGEEKLLTPRGLFTIHHTLLPYNRIQTSDFSWSPDSSRIAYVSDESGACNIRLVNTDGSSDTQLTSNDDPNVILSCPIWSADGERVAYTSRTDKPTAAGEIMYNLSIVDTKTKTRESVLQKNTFFRLIGWEQNDRGLILASLRARTATTGLQAEISLLYVDAKTGAARDFHLLKNSYLYNINLSPDKKKVAFVSNQGGQDNVWIVFAEGGEEKKLTVNNDSRLYFSSMSWSPDSGTIFFGKQLRYSLLSMLTNFK